VCYQTGDCCDDHGGVGCLDPWIESCVCNADSYCCDVAWDSQCAQEVVEFGCGDCGIAVVIPTGDCCEPHGGYGCLDPWVESCVCDYDPYCCDTAWDSQCVDIAVTEGCADCGVVVVPPPPPAPTGPVGCFGFCGDQSPDGCFCDEQCAAYGDCCPDLCDSCFTTAQCGPSCLDVQPGPGCGDAACEDCVCSADSYCCATAWDEVCVELVTTLDCWMCE
ncbi:MAG: hypothetical protein HUU55_03345, partial [Myxococcales bacterium]|nr:hypothetical protein [Myxococcales bacterium]